MESGLLAHYDLETDTRVLPYGHDVRRAALYIYKTRKRQGISYLVSWDSSVSVVVRLWTSKLRKHD
jgi:hypothetical protein